MNEIREILKKGCIEGLSEQESYELYEQSLIDNYSHGRIMLCYPRVRESKAKKTYTCHMSGAQINIGTRYYRYSIFLENINTNEKYVLSRDIILESDYYVSDLPSNIREIDDYNSSVINDSTREELLLFSQEYGEMNFIKLGKKKVKINENRIC